MSSKDGRCGDQTYLLTSVSRNPEVVLTMRVEMMMMMMNLMAEDSRNEWTGRLECPYNHPHFPADSPPCADSSS